MNKFDVVVYYDVDGISDPLVLGKIMVDLDAPCEGMCVCVYVCI